MAEIPPPPAFKPEGDREYGWKQWKTSFEIYLCAKGLDDANGKRKVSLLLHFLGPDSQKLFNTFEFRAAQGGQEAESKDNLKDVLKKFDQHYSQEKARNIRRQLFLDRDQRQGESVRDYIAELRHLARSCEYENAEESLICDRIIRGVSDQQTKRDLLDLDELTLENCLRIACRDEMTNLQMKKKTDEADVNRIGKQRGRGQYRQRGRSRGARDFAPRRGRGTYRDHREEQSSRQCDFCCTIHPPSRCPAYHKYCGNCGTKGHFARSSRCQAQRGGSSGWRGRGRSNRGRRQQNVAAVNTEHYDYANEHYDNTNEHYDNVHFSP